MKQRILFLLLLLCGALGILPAATADTGILAYVIEKLKFEELVPGTTNQLREIEKCVFYPIVDRNVKDSIYRRHTKEAAKNLVASLQSLPRYYVYQDGRKLDIQFRDFHVSASDLPAYFATSAVPRDGCGQFLVRSEKAVIQANEPEYLREFESLLMKNEKELFVSAFKKLSEWVTERDRENISKHDLARTYEDTERSAVRTFYDGKSWYLVRSYSAGNKSPTGLNVMILFEPKLVEKSLHPNLVFVNSGRDEGSLSIRYFGALDLNGDSIAEMIFVASYLPGPMAPGRSYHYFSRTDGRWGLH
jgi:hypothetical protein